MPKLIFRHPLHQLNRFDIQVLNLRDNHFDDQLINHQRNQKCGPQDNHTYLNLPCSLHVSQLVVQQYNHPDSQLIFLQNNLHINQHCFPRGLLHNPPSNHVQNQQSNLLSHQLFSHSHFHRNSLLKILHPNQLGNHLQCHRNSQGCAPPFNLLVSLLHNLHHDQLFNQVFHLLYQHCDLHYSLRNSPKINPPLHLLANLECLLRANQ